MIENRLQHPLPDPAPALLVADHKVAKVADGRGIRDHAGKASEYTIPE